MPRAKPQESIQWKPCALNRHERPPLRSTPTPQVARIHVSWPCITLALGIGLNTAIFSLINDLFLRGLPFREQGRLVHLFAKPKDREVGEFPLSAPRFMHYRDGQTIFDGFAAENGSGATLTGLGDPALIQIFRATSNWFDVLGVRPIRGRTFLKEEEEGADVAMVTENFWRKRLGGDPNVIGRSITLDGVAHTIVGVLPNMPVAWVGPNGNEVWTTKPFVIPGFSHERMMRGTGFLRVIGRLKPGQTMQQVRAALPSLDQSYGTQYPEKIDAQFPTIIKDLREDVTGDLRPAFATLLAAVAFVLLIACSNVANLLLVRFSGRRREIALRMAIGASRASVMRLFVFESLLVSALAGLAGAALAWWLVPLVPKMASNFLPLEPNYHVGLSLPLLGFTIALSLLTGLAMGIYPALQSSRADLVEGLKEGGRGTAGSVKQQRFRKLLVGAQVALSVTLAGRRGAAHHQFRALEQTGPRFSPAKSLGRFCHNAGGAISRPRRAGAIWRSVAQNIANHSGIRRGFDKRRFPIGRSAIPKRFTQGRKATFRRCRNGRALRRTMLPRDFSRPGAFRFWPDATLTNTTSKAAGTWP